MIDCCFQSVSDHATLFPDVSHYRKAVPCVSELVSPPLRVDVSNSAMSSSNSLPPLMEAPTPITSNISTFAKRNHKEIAEKKLILVDVPPGTAPGSILKVQVPGQPGRILRARVPAGNAKKFHVAYY